MEQVLIILDCSKETALKFKILRFFIFNFEEIIGSYCDEDIYLFESEQDERKDAKYRYNGHRNSDTSIF